MEKVLFKTKYAKFKIAWHSNIFLLGVVKDNEEFVICLFQIAFVFDISQNKRKRK